MHNDDYYLLVNHIFHDQPRRMVDVLNLFPDVHSLQTHAQRYAEETRMSDKQRHAMRQTLATFSGDHVREAMSKQGVHALTWDSDDYPPLLREISDPPPVLYIKGRHSLLQRDCFAVVGSREMTPYGQEVTGRFVQELAPYFVIVSGLAAGIDTIAHETAVRLGHPTIAVVATGLDKLYPAENSRLASHIQENGILVSEYPLGTPAVGYRFPQRNRIIAGLSRGILVCEARQQSGAMITAKHAMEQNRDVFAVPGPIFSRQSDGCHSLIQDGAKLVRSGEDVLNEYHFLPFSKTKITPLASLTTATHSEKSPLTPPESLTSLEKMVWEHLGDTPVQMEELLALTGVSVAQLLSVLGHFESQKWVTVSPGHYYSKQPPAQVMGT